MEPVGSGTEIYLAVEGSLDEDILQRLLQEFSLTAKKVYGLQGKEALLARLSDYNNSARHQPWLVAVDLNGSAPCAPSIAPQWLPRPSPLMLFSVAVRTIEAWLLADREGFSKWLEVPANKVGIRPETLENPKKTLVRLASGSRRRDVREGIAPAKGMAGTGPLYRTLLAEFVRDSWNPRRAAKHSPSLARCLRRMEEWAAKIPAP